MSLVDRITNSGIKLPPDYWCWTAVLYEEPKFRRMLELCRPIVAVEIGPCFGVSTALIAEYASAHVHTIDFVEFNTEQNVRDQIWKSLGVDNKISFYLCRCSAVKKELVQSFKADFAFIDGCHMKESIEFDYDCVKDCKNVLFHDHGTGEWPDVTQFVSDLEDGNVMGGGNNFSRVELDVPFALFTRK
jgi:hypothetical protein